MKRNGKLTRKKLLPLALSWGSILLIALLLIEARYACWDYAGKYTISHQLLPEIGIWRKPHQLGTRIADCYRVDDIEVNALGMRAAAPDSSKQHKIAYFGDSMLEGVQVSQEDHFIYQLNQQDSQHDHLNFGMSSTGTVAQWAHFLYFSQFFEFDHVYLFFYAANDLRNNSLALERRANGGKRGYLPHFVRQDSSWQLDRNFDPWGKFHWLNRSHLIRKLKGIYAQMGNKRNKGHAAIPYHDLAVFQPQYDSLWQEAETITQHSIQLFAASCRARNISFTLVLIPSLNELLNEKERAHFHPAYHQQLDWEKPYQRFRQFCDTSQISRLDGYAFAREKIQKEKLAFPYLSLPCDGHLGKKGHQMLTEMLSEHSCSRQ